MAELLAKKLAAERGLPVEAKSCGVAAHPDFQIPPGVFAAMEREAIRQFEHTPQPATKDLLDWADLVLVMTSGHRETVLKRHPEAAAKTFLLRAYAGLGDENIEDPIGWPDPIYAQCCAKIKEAVSRLLDKACRVGEDLK